MRTDVQENHTDSAVASFFEQCDRTKVARLLLDYDGTLAPFQADRHTAYPYAGVIPLLENIIQARKTEVSIVSGRPVSEIQSLLTPLRNFEIWGAHGLEHLTIDGVYSRNVIDPEVLAVLQEAENWLRQSNLLSITEIKPGGLAVHWRGLSSTETESLSRSIEKEWDKYSQIPGIKLLSFDGGVELRSAYPDKGDAVSTILANTDSAAAVAFLGDDLTDEDAFRILNQRGLSILVRPEYRTTSANVWLKTSGELIGFLALWAEYFA